MSWKTSKDNYFDSQGNSLMALKMQKNAPVYSSDTSNTV